MRLQLLPPVCSWAHVRSGVRGRSVGGGPGDCRGDGDCRPRPWQPVSIAFAASGYGHTFTGTVPARALSAFRQGLATAARTTLRSPRGSSARDPARSKRSTATSDKTWFCSTNHRCTPRRQRRGPGPDADRVGRLLRRSRTTDIARDAIRHQHALTPRLGSTLPTVLSHPPRRPRPDRFRQVCVARGAAMDFSGHVQVRDQNKRARLEVTYLA